MRTQLFLKGYKRDLTTQNVKAGLIVHKEFVRKECPNETAGTAQRVCRVDKVFQRSASVRGG